MIVEDMLRDECAALYDEIARLADENAKLRELAEGFAQYVNQDRCEGCIVKRRCNDGDVEECWQRTELRRKAKELGIGVD